MKFELEPYYRNLNLTEDELIDDLKRVSQEVGDSIISKEDYGKLGKYSCTMYRNRFGSWRNALEKAGLQRARNWGTTEAEYWDNLKQVWIKLGRQPRYKEMMIPFSKLSGTAYLHRFGSWRKALERFVEIVNSEDFEEYLPLEEKDNHIKNFSHRTNRQPNLRLRFLVMKRDNFKCVFCGKSPANQIGIELVLDHKTAWSKGGETTFDNLQTLCSDCNSGKSNLEM